MNECEHSYYSPTKSSEQLVTDLGENKESQNDTTLTDNFHDVQKSLSFSNNNIYESEIDRINNDRLPMSEISKTQENEIENESHMDCQHNDNQQQKENTELVDKSDMDSSFPENLKGDNSLEESDKLDQSQSNNETNRETSKTKEISDVTETGSENVDNKTDCDDNYSSVLKHQEGESNGTCTDNEMQKQNVEDDSKEKDGVEENDAATSPLSKIEDDVLEDKESKVIDEDIGIPIDESKMVKREDVYGPGKRSRKSALPKDYLDDIDLQEKLDKKSPFNKSFNTNSSPVDVFKKLPASSKFNSLDLDKVTLPFKQGWKREIVLRNQQSAELQKDRLADIYYFTPNGRKLRSMPQIIEFLEKNKSPFTRENFTFFKQPISEPPYETIRHAGRSLNLPHHPKKRKKKSICDDSDLPDDDDQSFDKPEVVIERDSDGMVSPLIISSPQQKVKKAKTSKFKITPLRPVQSMKLNMEKSAPVEMIICPKTEPVEEKKVLTAEDVLSSPLLTEEMLMNNTDNHVDDIMTKDNAIPEYTDCKDEGEPPTKKYKPTARKSTTQKAFRSPFRNNIRSESGQEALCSLNCPGQENIPPDLHCSVCLCLFHPQCVNYEIDSEHAFVCLRCSDPDQLKERLSRTKGRHKSTLTSMLSKPPLVSTAGYTTYDNLKIKQEPKDDDEDEYGKISGHFSSEILNGGMEPQRTGNIAADSNSNSTGVTGQTLGSLRTVLDKRNTATNIPTFLTTPPPNIAHFQSVNLATPQIVGNTKLPYNTIPSVPGPSSTRLIHASLLPVLRPGQVLPSSRIVTTAVNSLPLLSNFSNVPTVVQTSMPKLSTGVTTCNSLPVISSVYSAVSANLDRNSPQISSIQPPKLKAAPMAPAMTSLLTPSQGLPINSQMAKDSKSGQLLTLPAAVVKRLNLNQPLALKINNMQVIVPPSSFLHTTEGLRVFLPRNTFPVGTGETTKVSVTVTNEKNPTSEGGNNSVQFDINSSTSEKNRENMTVPSDNTTPQQNCHDIQSANKCKINKWKSGSINPGMCFMKKLYGGFDCLMEVFRYLNVKDLVRVGMVCQSWRNISTYPSLWKEVKLKDVNIPDWELFVRFLKSRSVECLFKENAVKFLSNPVPSSYGQTEFRETLVETLCNFDLMNMVDEHDENKNLHGLKHIDNPNRTWHQLVAVIDKLTNIRKLHFELVPASVLHSICPKMPQLQVLTASWISDMKFQENDDEQIWSIPTKLDLSKFSKLSCLEELRLRGIAGLTLPFNNGPLELVSLKNLRFLSLTSLKDLSYDELGFLSSLNQLESLEIGDCTKWSSETYFQLGSLLNLKSLRLECGGEIPDVGLSDALQNMKSLENLELIMYAVAESLASALEQLVHLKTLKVWPDTSNYPASTVNSNTLRAVGKAVNLERLEWGILNNINSSIILDSEGNDSKDNQSERAIMIPILPDTNDQDIDDQNNTETMTEYVFLQQFREKISKMLPKTKIKVSSVKMISAREELKR